MSSSALQTLLDAEQSGGTLESCGVFTLSNRQALEKLSAYTLPRPSAWILRIVQAAVAAGSERLQIARSRHTVRFGFQPATPWSRAVFEATFLDAAPCSDVGLDAFKRALWHKGLHERRPFRLLLPHERHALVWDGRDLHQQKVEQTVAWVQLTVCHQPQIWSREDTYQPGYSIDAINDALGSELRRFAHACPIPLELEGVRIDRLQHALARSEPHHAFPLGVIALHPPLPAQPVPRGTLRPMPALPGSPPQELQVWGDVASATTCCLASLDLRRAPEKDGYRGFEMTQHPSRLMWVQHGIIIGEERLPLKPRPISLSLYASAAHLDTDVSGLNLVLGQPEQIQRRRAVGAALQQCLPRLPSGLQTTYHHSQKQASTTATRVGGCIIAATGYLTWMTLPGGLATATLFSWLPLAGSALGTGVLREFSRAMENSRQKSFERWFSHQRELLEKDWREARPAEW